MELSSNYTIGGLRGGVFNSCLGLTFKPLNQRSDLNISTFDVGIQIQHPETLNPPF